MDKGDIFCRGNEVRTWKISWTRDAYFEVAYVMENEEDTKKTNWNECVYLVIEVFGWFYENIPI